MAALDPAARRAVNQPIASYDPGPLDAGRWHFWRVISRNANGETAGAVWRFRVRSAPAKAAAYATDFAADPWDESWTQQVSNCDTEWIAMRAGPMRAGGTAPDMVVFGDDAATGVARLVSPRLQTGDAAELVAGFRSSLGWFFEPPVGAELAVQWSTNLTDWVDAAAWCATAAPPAEVVVGPIRAAAAWLAWTLRGDLSGVEAWAIDDVVIYEPVRLAIQPGPAGARLEWNDAAGSTGYTVQVCRDLAGGAWSNTAATAGTAWTNAPAAQPEFFRVRAGVLFESP